MEQYVFIGNQVDYRVWTEMHPHWTWFCDVNGGVKGIFDCLESLNGAVYSGGSFEIRRNYAPLFYWWFKAHDVKATIKQFELGGKKNG